MNNIGSFAGKPDSERQHVEAHLDYFERTSNQVWQFEPADTIEQTRLIPDAQSTEAVAIEVIRDRTQRDGHSFRLERPTEIRIVVGYDT
jgi:hypothetical protein